MTATTATLSVRTYTIARDMWEAGDCATCAACGRSIRHVTEINGTTYGTRCAEAIIGTAETVVAAPAPVTQVAEEVTFEAIATAAISPLRKSIARQELAAKKLALAATYFEGGMTIINRHMTKPVWLLQEQAINSTTGKGLAYALMVEVKQAMGLK